MAYSLTREDIENYQRDGAICLRGVFDSDWQRKIATGIEKTIDAPSQYSERLRGEEGNGTYFNDYCNWQLIEEFQDLVFNSPAAEIAGKLLETEYVSFYHEHVLTKDPNTIKVTPWHHDQAYYPVDGFKNCSMWIPIDPVSMKTTIQFIRGSHRWDRWFHPKKFATENPYQIITDSETGHVYEQIPDIDKNLDKYEIIRWAVQPGDCVIFHMQTVHGAPANTTPIPRRVVSLRWTGDDCVLARRPWKVSPPITGGLNYGDKLVCDTFPIVWKAPSA